MILKYQVFPSSEAFEKFQAENSINVSQITPLVSGMQLDVGSNGTECKAQTNIAVFVVYSNRTKMSF